MNNAQQASLGASTTHSKAGPDKQQRARWPSLLALAVLMRRGSTNHGSSKNMEHLAHINTSHWLAERKPSYNANHGVRRTPAKASSNRGVSQKHETQTHNSRREPNTKHTAVTMDDRAHYTIAQFMFIVERKSQQHKY